MRDRTRIMEFKEETRRERKELQLSRGVNGIITNK
jgi:hypothetical protein